MKSFCSTYKIKIENDGDKIYGVSPHRRYRIISIEESLYEEKDLLKNNELITILIMKNTSQLKLNKNSLFEVVKSIIFEGYYYVMIFRKLDINGNPLSKEKKCVHCRKSSGDHHSKSQACPVGIRRKTIGFTQFSKECSFESKSS